MWDAGREGPSMQSTLFTIGTALSRARDHGVVVRVLVAGHWIEGMVSEVDGHGVVLTGSGTTTAWCGSRTRRSGARRTAADEPHAPSTTWPLVGRLLRPDA